MSAPTRMVYRVNAVTEKDTSCALQRISVSDEQSPVYTPRIGWKLLPVAVTRIVPLVVAGQAANILLDEAREADLLVLGARGHGGFAGLLLGSVTNTITHHAPCPVVIVPTGDGD